MRKLFENVITVIVALLGLILSIIWYRTGHEIEPLIGIVTCAGALATNIVYRFFPEEKSATQKNINSGNINADGNLIIGDNNKIQHILGNLDDYQNLEQILKEDRHLLSISDDQQARGIISTRINKNEEKRESIKKAIEQAFDYISKITISTDRLVQAKALFLEGDIPGALKILKDEAIQADYLALQTAKQSEAERHSRLMEEIAKKTKGIAEEWKMKAVLMATQYEDTDWFEKTKGYYEKTLEVDRNVEHIFTYAKFLQDHNQYKEATPLYEEALQIYRKSAKSNPDAFLPNLANTLNNLAVLHRAKNELKQAQGECEEALQIYRKLAKSNPEAFLQDVAMTLNNLMALHYAKNKLKQAQGECEEALQIYRNLAKSNPEAFLKYVAGTLNNLAILLSAKNELEQAQRQYEEALQIRRTLAKSNPEAFLPDLATTLNNLAILHREKNELELAQGEYQEALQIYRILAKSNPEAFLQDVATTLNNLAILHRAKNELEQAQAEYQEALYIRRTLANSNPEAFLKYVANTLNNLANLHCEKNEMELAQGEYEEALQIYRTLVNSNPEVFMPYLANTASNLALFYQDNQPDRERSLELLKEALRGAMPFGGYLKFAQNTIEIAKTVIEKWGLNMETFLKELEAENK